ncbi:MAG: hypothetical protein JRF51_14750 [Deltaproteobacteria bacterium]|nr:hypothetical protein [Deltaproteobacteria bacterium]MBW2354465.1 hypothetical protein [Deltaproteobacteria bacterium]
MKDHKAIKIPMKKDEILRPSPSYVDVEEKKMPSGKDASLEPVSGKECTLPPLLFQHEDLVHALENAEVIDEKSLTNTLNHIHFMDRYLLVQLRHPKYNDSVILKARPDPCLDRDLTCHFVDRGLAEINLKDYELLHLIIDDGQSVILVPAALNEMDRDSFFVQLPHKSYRIGRRQTKRYYCQGVEAELIQSGLLIKGELLDFSPEGLRVRISHLPFDTFDWSPDSALLTMVHLRRNQQVLFSSLCTCIRQHETLSSDEVVLALSSKQAKRPARRQLRIPTQDIPLRPVIVFTHPFIDKRMQFDALDISTSSFSVCEDIGEGVLIEGMIIPELTIEFANAIKIKCAAQVISRSEMENKKVRCGFAILDMEINSYSRLSHVLANSLDTHAHVSNKVEMDELWEFFFESGFIYPEKYGMLSYNRKRFKETYARLYRDNPEISKHFTYQRNGRIYGHISMIRAYERAWMIHHHAARSVEGRRAGFSVLKQIMLYLDDIHRLPSAKMDYVMSFFRPENKFPDRVFGGFARELENPRGCSMDLFSYLPYRNLVSGATLLKGWTLGECSQLDLWELDRFYSNYSGGLLIDAVGLRQNNLEEESLKEVYSRYGFLRKWTTYALKQGGELNAVLVVDQSDLGFNLSELLNGIKILVVNINGLPWDVLSMAIAQLVSKFPMVKVPILLYPFEYVKGKGVPYEKQYYAWVLNVRYGNEYMEYMRKKFRLNYK